MFSLGCSLLLALPVADARLPGYQVQEAPPGVSCDQQSAGSDFQGARDAFDELALLQRTLTPAGGFHAKSLQEWASHWDDHATKIGSDQRVLDKDTFAGQFAKLSSGDCADDPMWLDADGDGCEIYRFAIESGKTTQQLACNGGGISENPGSQGLRGARSEIIADATAKLFCPLTCGMCRPETRSGVDDAAVDATEKATAVELEGGSSDPADTFFLQVSSSSGLTEKQPEFWAEHVYDHKSRIMPDEQVLDNETVSHHLAMLQKGEGCADDPLWRDADGDGCEIYKFAIESGKTTVETACGGGGRQKSTRLRGSTERVVADATAKIFCPVTCGTC